MTVAKIIATRIAEFQHALGLAWFPLLISTLVFGILCVVGLAVGQVQEVLANYVANTAEPCRNFAWGRAGVSLLAIWLLSAIAVESVTSLLKRNLREVKSFRELPLWDLIFICLAWFLPWLGAMLSFGRAHAQAVASARAAGADALVSSPFIWLAGFALIFPIVVALVWWAPPFKKLRIKLGEGHLGRLVFRFALPAVFAVLVIAFLWLPPAVIEFARMAGPITLACISLAGITAAGAWLISVSRHRKLPFFTVVAMLPIAVGAFGCDDNHFLRQRGEQAEVTRPTFTAALTAFADARPDEPIIFVSTEGGGVRAAYYTAMVLSRLADQCPRVARRIFLISGVSGGSIGASAYRAALDRMPLPEGEAGEVCALNNDPGMGDRQEALHRMLNRDHLSAALGKQAFPELVQLFFPASMFGGADRAIFPATDRQLGLERSFEQAFAESFEIADDETSPMTASVFRSGDPLDGPHLLLNLTDVESGRPHVASSINLTEIGVVHPWLTDFRCVANNASDHCETSPDFRLSTMAGTSARFPGISPAGTYRAGDRTYRYVDGGYFDNSGIETVLALLEYLEIRQEDLDQRLRRRIVVLHIDSNPRGLTPAPMGESRTPPLDFNIHELGAVLATREARVDMSFNTLDNLEDSFRFCSMISTELRQGPGPSLRLGWILSQPAASEMRTQANEFLEGAANDREFEPGFCWEDWERERLARQAQQGSQ